MGQALDAEDAEQVEVGGVGRVRFGGVDHHFQVAAGHGEDLAIQGDGAQIGDQRGEFGIVRVAGGGQAQISDDLAFERDGLRIVVQQPGGRPGRRVPLGAARHAPVGARGQARTVVRSSRSRDLF